MKQVTGEQQVAVTAPEPEHNISNEDRARIAAQLRVWRERLVDLTRGNPLLGLNRARTSKLRVLSPSASELFDVLVVDSKPLRMPLVRKRAGLVVSESAPDTEPADSDGAWQVTPGDVAFDSEPGLLQRRLRRIRDNARTTVEERGVTTLHLALGTVAWSDLRLGESVAPLWLVPCTLIRTGADSPLRLEMAEDEPQLNPALALYLRQLHDTTLPELPDEPIAGQIGTLLGQVRTMLGSDFEIRDEAWLSTFSFEMLVLYKDLENLADAAVEHAVVRAFAGASVDLSEDASERLGDDPDALPTPEVAPIPALPADSSQLKALTHAHVGSHLLVHGPPGTGKSQTISNLIADALGQGKTVLFVSAKMAALEVVHDRLLKQGFGRFCLEAHSTRSGKAKVIDELRATLAAAESANGARYEVDAQRFTDLREQLNQAVRELHRRRLPLGQTIYSAIGQFARLKRLPDVRAALPWPDPTTVSVEQLNGAKDRLRDLQAHATVFASRDKHPWRGCQLEDATYATRESLLAAFEELRNSTSAVLSVSNTLEPYIGLVGERSFDELEGAAKVFGALAEAHWLPTGWTAAPAAQLEQTADLLRDAAAARRERDDALASFNAGVSEPRVEPDQVSALLTEVTHYTSWLSRLGFGYRGWKKQVMEKVRPVSLDYRDLVALEEAAEQARVRGQWLTSHRAALELVPSHTDGGDGVPSADALDDAAAAYRAAATLMLERERLGIEPSVAEPGTVLPGVRQAAQTIRGRMPSARAELADALAVVKEAFGDEFLSDGFLADQPVTATPLSTVASRTRDALAAGSELSAWVDYKRARRGCADSGLGPFVKGLERYGVDRAVDLFERRFWMAWLDAQIHGETCLRDFVGSRREELIAEFGRTDTLIRQAATRAAIHGAAQGAVKVNTNGYVAKNSQLGILRYELQRKRPRPLRRLFAEIPQVLQAIKPCLLMSPVSVSTYLARGQFHFDLVVFDEASQIPTAEAIPSILRATQVIVAGDDKQLPPSSFFSTSLFADEADEEEARTEAQNKGTTAPQPYEPLESLLNECEATGPLFQGASLKWHYRSRDERLIAFSNQTFYGGDLITFPCPGQPADRGVQLHYLSDGVWDRGHSRTNRVEARKMAELVLAHLEAHPDRSMGVVALSVSQKEAIEDALEEALVGQFDMREELFREDVREPFFIKSLENVQGDERDTIFISTGYGRDSAGTMSLNFGPINQERGWRRLNVLVTRAKFLTVLVTSLRSEQLHAVAPGNRGAVALREFIAYAQRGGRLSVEAPRLTGAETNEFEDAIAAALRARGLKIAEQVGASSFRIDLAVHDPRDESRYVLGIECDGATYHSSRAARDRDVLRAQMLRDMGWHLHRIWSVDWFKNPEGCIDSAIRAVDRAMAIGAPETGVRAPEPASAHPATECDPPDGRTRAPSNGKYPPGVFYRLTPTYLRDRNILMNPHYGSQRIDEIRRIVHHEEPIHEDLVLRRACELNDVASAKSNVRANFGAALATALKRGYIRRDEHGFLHATDQPVSSFRVPRNGQKARDIDQISPDEISLAVLHVVESQFGLERKDLVTETAHVLGYGKTSADISVRIGTIVDGLIEAGELRTSGFQITLP